MKKILIATSNLGKLKEFKELLEPLNYKVLCLKDFDLDIDIEENGETFEENAFIKAKAIYDIVKIPVIADDSGLCVEALNGEPGIYSARYYKGLRDSEKNIDYLLEKMKDITNRNAYFVCAMVYYAGEKENICSIGKSFGFILEKRKGNNGFGYDSIFYSNELSKSFAEATNIEKNRVSHRAKALKELVIKIK